MNIFKALSQNVIKWWHVHVVYPVRLKYVKKGRKVVVQEETVDQFGNVISKDVDPSFPQALRNPSADAQGAFGTAGAAGGSDLQQDAVPGVSADAMAVLNRINSDSEAKHRDEVERLRKKQEEDARIAAIMKAGKVDVNAFIAEGRQRAGESASYLSEAPVMEFEDERAAAAAANSTDEQLRLAQEIMERLNREAAEDDAKKQAEIDAARKQAHDAGLV